MGGLDMARRAKEQVEQITGLKADTVSAVSKDGEGWHVVVDMVEYKRISEAVDVLATYEVVLSEAGDLIRYQRTRRYYRGQVA